MGRVGILIPAFNSASTIQETLESVENQKSGLAELEGVWLADDGSSDLTIQTAVASWTSKVPLHVSGDGHNRGQWRNVNETLARLSSVLDWVLILHADDLVHPRWLEWILKTIESGSPRLGSIGTYYEFLLSDGHTRRPGRLLTDESTVFVGGPEAVRFTLNQGCWWHISGCAIRMATYKDVGPFREDFDYSADWEWLLRCLDRGWNVQYLSEALHARRQSPTGVAGSSLPRDRDVTEALRLLNKYPHLLSRKEVREFHIRRAGFIIRRTLRALLDGRLSRLRLSANTLKGIARSYSAFSRQSARGTLHD